MPHSTSKTQITLKDTVDNVDCQAVSAIFTSVEWGTLAPEELQQAFNRSGNVRFAYCQEELIGFGRTIDDGRFYAAIVDLVVKPRYQGQGVGRQILESLSNATDSYLFTTLTAAPGKGKFYQKQGWYPLKGGYILPRSDKQKSHYT